MALFRAGRAGELSAAKKGTRMSPVSKERRKRLRDDGANWKLGIFYFCPQDPSFLIPKRVGIGWSLNFGSPWSLLFFLVVIAVLVWGVFF
jgi:uncharacterized membrane protein